MSFQSSRKQIKYKQPNSWWLRFRRVVQKTVKVFNKAGGGHLTGRLPKATHLDSKYNHYIAATPGSEDQNCTYTQGSGTQKTHVWPHFCSLLRKKYHFSHQLSFEKKQTNKRIARWPHYRVRHFYLLWQEKHVWNQPGKTNISYSDLTSGGNTFILTPKTCSNVNGQQNSPVIWVSIKFYRILLNI